jgi:hypothetical protein
LYVWFFTWLGVAALETCRLESRHGSLIVDLLLFG